MRQPYPMWRLEVANGGNGGAGSHGMTVAPTTSKPSVGCRRCASHGLCTCRIHFVTSLQTLYPTNPYTGHSERMSEF